VKRSRRIRLVLIGGLSAGAATSCGPSGSPPGVVSANSVYTNNHYLPGVGYYHAPFRAWYSQPYNHFDPQSRRYFFGGRWAAFPHESITNISAPTPAAVQQAHAQQSSVTRGGFGSTSHRHYIHS
jgi:hypothetical protein